MFYVEYRGEYYRLGEGVNQNSLVKPFIKDELPEFLDHLLEKNKDVNNNLKPSIEKISKNQIVFKTTSDILLKSVNGEWQALGENCQEPLGTALLKIGCGNPELFDKETHDALIKKVQQQESYNEEELQKNAILGNIQFLTKENQDNTSLCKKEEEINQKIKEKQEELEKKEEEKQETTQEELQNESVKVDHEKDNNTYSNISDSSKQTDYSASLILNWMKDKDKTEEKCFFPIEQNIFSIGAQNQQILNKLSTELMKLPLNDLKDILNNLKEKNRILEEKIKKIKVSNINLELKNSSEITNEIKNENEKREENIHEKKVSHVETETNAKQITETEEKNAKKVENNQEAQPNNLETALSNVSDAKINGDDDSAMKALRNNEKLYSEKNKENKETTSQEEHQDQEQSSVKRQRL
ncbi:hypothetical protein M8548_001274 [Campylobacter coli]|nr:hypothetical protein [Campylobacter coli]